MSPLQPVGTAQLQLKMLRDDEAFAPLDWSDPEFMDTLSLLRSGPGSAPGPQPEPELHINVHEK